MTTTPSSQLRHSSADADSHDAPRRLGEIVQPSTELPGSPETVVADATSTHTKVQPPVIVEIPETHPETSAEGITPVRPRIGQHRAPSRTSEEERQRRVLHARRATYPLAMLLTLGSVTTAIAWDYLSNGPITAPPAAASQPINVPAAAPKNVDAPLENTRIDDNILTNAQVTPFPDGQTLQAEATKKAVRDTGAFGNGLEKTLSNSCITNATVTTVDNLTVNAWGFCRSSLPGPAMGYMISYAETTRASRVSFQQLPTDPVKHRVTMRWETDNPGDFESIREEWKSLNKPAEVDEISLELYGTGQLKDRSAFGRVNGDQLVLGNH